MRSLALLLLPKIAFSAKANFANYKQMVQVRSGSGVGFFLPSELGISCPDKSSTFSRIIETAGVHNYDVTQKLQTFMRDFTPWKSSFMGCVMKTDFEFPEGNYCFVKAKRLKCPDGFLEKYLVYDTKNSIKNKFYGNGDYPPSGYFKHDMTSFHHCCREDGDIKQEIAFDDEFNAQGFVLWKPETVAGCQKIKGYAEILTMWKPKVQLCVYQKPSKAAFDPAVGMTQGFGYFKTQNMPCGNQELTPNRKPPFYEKTLGGEHKTCLIDYFGTKRGTFFSKGNYCIIRNGVCPFGFYTTISNSVPLCCRRDAGPTTRPNIRFPTKMKPDIFTVLGFGECPVFVGQSVFVGQNGAFDEELVKCSYRNV